ncbi:MAG: site-specific DNA-methyltransferase [Hyphomonas sp.]|nr:site-specific DNA-methyltransferase [Hyphomonas sp.]
MTDQPEKMPLTSMDIAAEKREALKQLFPEVFAEDSIDFDQLKRVLGDWVEPGKERFGLTWPGKAECMRIIQSPSVATLKPMRDESVNFDETDNVFIEGDNLEVLKLLQKAYFGKVKMIYIDPPYNTGKEFIYPDKFAETLDTYLAYSGQVDDEGRKFSTNTDTGGRYHSSWLSMMYPRLYLARNLLRRDGVICISIDDHEVMNLRSVCDLIFGEENHVATISVLNNLKGRNDRKNVATSHEYMILYGNENFESYGLPLTPEQLEQYKYKDSEGHAFALRDLRKRGGADKRSDRPNLFFPIYYCKETKECSLDRQSDEHVEILPMLSDGTDGCWRWGKKRVSENLMRLHAKYNKAKDKWGVEYRVYLDPKINGDIDDDEADDDDVEFERTSKTKSFWWGADVSTDHAVRQFKELFDGMTTDYPKSPKLIQRLLHMATKDGDLVLDFFAGFSTTAHAILELDKQLGERRSFIMVQLPEPCALESEPAKRGYSTISDLSRERIRRVISKIEAIDSSELPLSGTDAKADLGFKSFQLSRTNFRIWEGEAPTFESELDLHVQNVDPSATPEDIVYELLLKAGFPLTTKVKAEEMAGKTVYSVEDGALLICLDNEITPALIDALADADPLQVICLDEGFKGNDQLKANAVQTFKARAASRETEIVFRTV